MYFRNARRPVLQPKEAVTCSKFMLHNLGRNMIDTDQFETQHSLERKNSYVEVNKMSRSFTQNRWTEPYRWTPWIPDSTKAQS